MHNSKGPLKNWRYIRYLKIPKNRKYPAVSGYFTVRFQSWGGCSCKPLVCNLVLPTATKCNFIFRSKSMTAPLVRALECWSNDYGFRRSGCQVLLAEICSANLSLPGPKALCFRCVHWSDNLEGQQCALHIVPVIPVIRVTLLFTSIIVG